uniref:Uncharacterized protein n=1 Tax=Cannabis sativa TaxID=3483 RepID=A0A803NVY2_CANSA
EFVATWDHVSLSISKTSSPFYQPRDHPHARRGCFYPYSSMWDRPARPVLDPARREITEAFVAGTMEVDILRKQNTLLHENVKKLKLEATSGEKDVEDLKKAKEQAEEKTKQAEDKARLSESRVKELTRHLLGTEVVKIAKAFRAMSPTQTQGCGGNLFPLEAENADTEEVVDGAASKVVDDSITPAP